MEHHFFVNPVCDGWPFHFRNIKFHNIKLSPTMRVESTI